MRLKVESDWLEGHGQKDDWTAAPSLIKNEAAGKLTGVKTDLHY